MNLILYHYFNLPLTCGLRDVHTNELVSLILDQNFNFNKINLCFLVLLPTSQRNWQVIYVLFYMVFIRKIIFVSILGLVRQFQLKINVIKSINTFSKLKKKLVSSQPVDLIKFNQ